MSSWMAQRPGSASQQDQQPVQQAILSSRSIMMDAPAPAPSMSLANPSIQASKPEGRGFPFKMRQFIRPPFPIAAPLGAAMFTV